MKLVVTGANGFTGKHFCHAAKNQYDVISLKANLLNREAVFAEIHAIQPDVIVHLAAISFVGHANINAFYDVNVVGTTNLLDALTFLKKSPEKILISSSANVYGNCEQSPISETQTPSPVNHYAISKMAMEYLAKTYVDKLPLFIVRPFNYTGCGQSESFVIPKLVAHFKQRAAEIELGNIHVEREFNDVRFVCDSYLKLLNNAKLGEIYNVCTGNLTNLSSASPNIT